jgi:hypothetical protein
MYKRIWTVFRYDWWHIFACNGWSTYEIVLKESIDELNLLTFMTKVVFPEDEDYFVRQIGKNFQCKKDFGFQISLNFWNSYLCFWFDDKKVALLFDFVIIVLWQHFGNKKSVGQNNLCNWSRKSAHLYQSLNKIV